jgi:hypothetical protein
MKSCLLEPEIPPMALLVRLYWNAVLGALGGLVGWFLWGLFSDKTIPPDWRQWLLGGACLGGAIGYFVVSGEALRDQSLVRFARLASHGLVLGVLGGGLGGYAAESLDRFLAAEMGGGSGPVTLEVLAALTRGLGGLILGVFVGAGEGVAAHSLARLRHGALGGAAGGFLGGSLAVFVGRIANPSHGHAADALGPMLLGACLAALAVLAQGVFQRACVRVLRGWQAGRVFGVQKANTFLGCDDHADVALFRDRAVEKKHAIIQREEYNRFILVNTASPERTRVNDEPVPTCRELHDGDRIQLGNTTLRFQNRARRQRSEVRSQRSEVRSQKSAGKDLSLLTSDL